MHTTAGRYIAEERGAFDLPEIAAEAEETQAPPCGGGGPDD
jgi:hypothetical protein